MRKIQLIINKSEITAGTRGASLGPEAVMAEARKKNNLFFGKYPQTLVKDMNHLLDQPIKYKYAKRIEAFLEVFQNVGSAVRASFDQGRFPLLLAADHGSAGGTIAGIRQAHPNKRLGIVWIDAHADMHTPYTTPSGNMHGMPLAIALGIDNLECQSNEPHEDVKELWKQLKEIGTSGATFQADDLVFIGVRDTEPQEEEIIGRMNITNHKVEEVRIKGSDEILRLTLEQLRECDLIYVSFDVDSMDPIITSHGTGTPVENGLTIEEAKNLVCGFAKQEKLACMEFVEVNPCLDEKTNKMAEITFELFEAAANAIAE